MKILLVGALIHVEINNIINALEEKEELNFTLCNCYKGKIGNNEIMVCHSSVGAINAAASTVVAIENFHPDYVIDAGCAGGYGDVHKGTIVVSEKSFNVGSIKTENDFIPGVTDMFHRHMFTFSEDDYDINNANEIVSEQDENVFYQKCSDYIISKAKEIAPEFNKTIIFGNTGSGDVWNCNKEMINFVYNKFGILCEAIEGHSVITVANRYNIPACEIRIVSNNSVMDEPYDRNVSLEMQDYIIRLLEAM